MQYIDRGENWIPGLLKTSYQKYLLPKIVAALCLLDISYNSK